MTDYQLKEDYTKALCCNPEPNDLIVGYYSHENVIKVHTDNCPNIANVEQSRLITLEWSDVLSEKKAFDPKQSILDQLELIDYTILKHHRTYGIDYSLVIARSCGIPKEEAFKRHKKLRDLGLVKRVEALIVQYRKGVVDNKWIKHRNHTYYELTEMGKSYLRYIEENDDNG